MKLGFILSLSLNFFLKDSEWVLTDIPLESTLNFQVVVEGINTNANFVYLKLILFGYNLNFRILFNWYRLLMTFLSLQHVVLIMLKNYQFMCLQHPSQIWHVPARQLNIDVIRARSVLAWLIYVILDMIVTINRTKILVHQLATLIVRYIWD